jgi:hypothetical protein
MAPQLTASVGEITSPRRVLAPVVLAFILAPTLSPSASAAVLHDAIPKQLGCGDAIVAGIWAQSWTTGNRTVRMKAVDRHTGKVWWRKKARALKSHWRTWYLPSGMNGQCSATTFVYQGRGWTATYRIRFKSEGV